MHDLVAERLRWCISLHCGYYGDIEQSKSFDMCWDSIKLIYLSFTKLDCGNKLVRDPELNTKI